MKTTNLLHVFRKVNSDWIYKGDFNLDTQETSFGSICFDDRIAFHFPDENSEMELMETAGEFLSHLFAPYTD